MSTCNWLQPISQCGVSEDGREGGGGEDVDEVRGRDEEMKGCRGGGRVKG